MGKCENEKRLEWNQAYLKFKFFNKICYRIIKITETSVLSKKKKEKS